MRPRRVHGGHNKLDMVSGRAISQEALNIRLLCKGAGAFVESISGEIRICFSCARDWCVEGISVRKEMERLCKGLYAFKCHTEYSSSSFAH